MTLSQVFTGYQEQREKMRTFLRRHYVEAFELRPGTLLDAGCGAGFWSGLFVEEGFEVTGVDIDAEFIESARAAYPAAGFLHADVMEPLPVGRYDVVFARTLPPFYARTLGPLTQLVGSLVGHVAAGGTLLLSMYSDGSGEDRRTLAAGLAHHHPHDDLIDAVDLVMPVWRWRAAGNYLQVGCRP